MPQDAAVLVEIEFRIRWGLERRSDRQIAVEGTDLVWIIIEWLGLHMEPFVLAEQIDRCRQIQSFSEFQQLLFDDDQWLNNGGLLESSFGEREGLVTFIG